MNTENHSKVLNWHINSVQANIDRLHTIVYGNHQNYTDYQIMMATEELRNEYHHLDHLKFELSELEEGKVREQR